MDSEVLNRGCNGKNQREWILKGHFRQKIRQKGGFCLLFDRLANALAAVGLKNNDDPAVFIDFIINNSIRVYPDFAFSPQPVP